MFDEINAYLDAREPELLQFLKKVVLIQSGTSNKIGVDEVGQAIVEALTQTGMKVREITHEQLGNILIFSTPAAEKTKNILLIGHMDTVFPPDTDFNWYREDTHKVYGPGVADMKGGLVVGIFALRTLADLGLLNDIPIKFIFNSDEEIGSPVSRHIIASEAKNCQAAFVLECGSLTDGVVTGRKGRIGFTLNVRGAAGHAAFADRQKKSAILELSHKVIELESLNGLSPGLTVNVGKIQGGIGPNTVADMASAEVDVRFVDPDESVVCEAELHRITQHAHIHGVETEVLRRSNRNPMIQSKANKKLFALVALQAQRLGFEIVEEYRRGCSDANIVADEGIPVVDGLGPLGDLDHSDKEYIVKNSLKNRCKLLALSIFECSNQLKKG